MQNSDFFKKFVFTILILCFFLPLFVIGEKFFLLLIGISFLVLVFIFIFKNDFKVLLLSIYVLGISPFYLDINIGNLPRIFVDEILFIFYLIYFLIVYFILRKKPFKVDFISYFFLFLFISLHSLSFFTNPTSYINVRMFIETYGWGVILFIIFYNEINQHNFKEFLNTVCNITLILSIYIILEYLFKINPVFKLAKFFPENISSLYISPEAAMRAGGVYRPYGPFFAPSAVGTFIAMGIPYLGYKLVTNQNKFDILKVFISIIAIIINYTRGVWFSLVVSSFIFQKKIRRLFPIFLLLGIVGFYIIILFFREHPFFKRLLDPTNLLARVAYWQISYHIIEQKILLGIGHLNFKNYYLYFIDYAKKFPGIDFKEVFVADNAYLTTLVEHGILGLFSFLALFSVFFKKLYSGYNRFLDYSYEKAEFLKAACYSMTIYLLAGMLADVNLFTKCTKYLFILLGAGMAVLRDIQQEVDEI